MSALHISLTLFSAIKALEVYVHIRPGSLKGVIHHIYDYSGLYEYVCLAFTGLSSS